MMNPMKAFSKFISRLFHPVLMFPLVLTLLFVHHNALEGLAVTLVVSFVIPLIYLLLRMKAGKVSNFDISDRKQRYPIYFVSLMGMIVSLTYSYLYLPLELFNEFLRLFILAVVIMVINFKVKLSIHTALMIVLGIVLVSYYEFSLWIFLLAPLVAYSRVTLKRHVPLEVVLGVIVPLLFYVDVIW